MTAMVGTLISKSGKESGSICLARRSLMNTNPLALPPSDPVPICVHRKVPSQNLRSKTGNSATRGFRPLIDTSPVSLADAARFNAPRRSGVPRASSQRPPSHPAASVARLGYAPNCDGVGRIPHVQLLTASQIGDCEVCRRHLQVELPEHFVFLPEVVHVALHLFEIAASDATGISQKVGDEQNVAFLNLCVGFRRRWPVGAFGDDSYLLTDTADVVAGDLVLHGRRDDNVDFLLKPCLPRQYFIAQFLGFTFVDPPEVIGDRRELAEVDSVSLAVCVGTLIPLIPAGDRDHPPSQLLVEIDCVVGHIAEPLDAGLRILGPNA